MRKTIISLLFVLLAIQTTTEANFSNNRLNDKSLTFIICDVVVKPTTQTKHNSKHNRNVFKLNEIEAIKHFEGFRDSIDVDADNKTQLIGYGFITKYWYKDQGNTITREVADSIIGYIYSRMRKSVEHNHQFATNKQKATITHLYYWRGGAEARKYIDKYGNFDEYEFRKVYEYKAEKYGLGGFYKRIEHICNGMI